MSAFGRAINRNWLDRQMEVLGLSQVDLASAAGISQPTVSAAMAGKPISPKSKRMLMALLAKRLGITEREVGEFLTPEPEQVPA